MIGTDAVGFDRDFPSSTPTSPRTTTRRSCGRPTASASTDEYFQIEKLANLDQLPTRGFKVACFPIKIARASAAWVRPVAMIGL